MKFRGHVLSVVFASVAGGLFWFWSQQSLWRVAGFDRALLAGYCKATHEVKSLVLRQGDDAWYLETRDGRDGRLLKDVKLDQLTKEDGVLTLANGTTDKPSHAPLVVISGKTRPFMSELALVYDPLTGNRRECIPISNDVGELPSISGDKVAIFSEQTLWLMEGDHQARKLQISGIRGVRISPDGGYVVCRKSDGLYILSWDSDQLIRAYPNDDASVYSDFSSFDFRFLKNGNLVLRQYLPACTLSRWRWDGTKLERVAFDMVIVEKEWDVGSHRFVQLMLMEDEQQTHLVSYAGTSWPREFRRLLLWLRQLGMPVEKWWQPETVLLWHVFDENHRELYRYEEHRQSYSMQRLTHHLQISFGRSKQDYGKSMEMWNMAPRWPNALASGVVVYLGLYVMGKCVGQRKMAR